MSKKSLFISGASGYIASNLLNHFKEKDFFLDFEKVYLIDKAFDRERIAFDIANFENIEIIEKDISAGLEISNKEGAGDICIHAAYLGDAKKEKSFLESFSLDTTMVLLSSSAVYGEAEMDGEKVLANKESRVLSPISKYGRYKKDLEEFVEDKFSKHLLLRISNPYGLEPDTRGVMKIFKERILAGEKIRLNEPDDADDSQKLVRDFIYIEDLAKSIYGLIDANKEGVFNLGSGDGISLQDLISSFAESYKKEARIECLGHKAGDIIKSVLDVTKLEEALKLSA